MSIARIFGNLFRNQLPTEPIFIRSVASGGRPPWEARLLRLPKLYHLMFEARAFERASRNRFVIAVQCGSICALFAEIGAERTRRCAREVGIGCRSNRPVFRGRGGDNMANQPKVNPYELSVDSKVDRPVKPVPHTVARDGPSKPPAPSPVIMALLERGQQRFDIYCSPCHRRVGDGQAWSCSAASHSRRPNTATRCAKRPTSCSTT